MYACAQRARQERARKAAERKKAAQKQRQQQQQRAACATGMGMGFTAGGEAAWQADEVGGCIARSVEGCAATRAAVACSWR